MVKKYPTTKHCSIVTRIHKPTFGYGEHRTLQTISCQTMTCTVASKLTINCHIITCTWLANSKIQNTQEQLEQKFTKSDSTTKALLYVLHVLKHFNHRDAHFIFPMCTWCSNYNVLLWTHVRSKYKCLGTPNTVLMDCASHSWRSASMILNTIHTTYTEILNVLTHSTWF